VSLENGGKQAIPASITGEVGEPGASVLDHKFGSSDPYTIGVEEEYQLLDADTLDGLLGSLSALIDETYESLVRTGFEVPEGTEFAPPPT